MTFLPEFELTVLNGFIPFGIYLILFFITVLTFSKDAKKRLYAQTFYSKKQKIFTIIRKLLALVAIITFMFSPLKIYGWPFFVGLVLFIIGLVGLTVSLVTYKKAPLNEPITSGLYSMSRNPQILSIWIIFLAISFMIQSILVVLVVLMMGFFTHWGILAEEQACEKLYGKSYKEYLRKVPRYM